jgi:myo-inositol-1(or 4)-monophosphatase
VNRTPAELLAIAQQAVQIGHDHILNTSPHEVRAKTDRDYVTDLDVRIERETRAFLAARTPEFGFFGEEEGPANSPADNAYTWILDPIDGTSNFVHGIPLCAVSLALLHHDEPTVAAVDLPFFNWQYTATKGGGAHRNGHPIHASTTTHLAKAIVSIGDYATGEDAEAKNARRLALTAKLAATVERVRMFGSAAIDLCWAAEGRTDACIILSNNPWDTAPGALIAREADLEVTDLDGNPHRIDSSTIIAHSPAIKTNII